MPLKTVESCFKETLLTPPLRHRNLWSLLHLALLTPLHGLRLLLLDFKSLLWAPFQMPKPEVFSERPHFFIAYFTCGAHFRYLKASVDSLLALDLPFAYSVRLFEDRKDPINADEVRQLLLRCPSGSTLTRTPLPFSWGGSNVIVSTRQAFKEIYSEMKSNDLLVKTDSDTLFLNSNIFEVAASCASQIVGQTHFGHGHKYFQGGCYFLRTNSIRRILSSPTAHTALLAAWSTEHYLSDLPEDFFFCLLAQKCNLTISFLDFYAKLPADKQKMLEDPSAAGHFLRRLPPNKSVLHFEKDKPLMHILAERLLGDKKSSPSS